MSPMSAGQDGRSVQRLLSLSAERSVDDGRVPIGTGVCEPFAERRRDGLVELWEQMAVPVEGDVDRGMSHPGLDGFRVGSLGDRQGDAAMSKVMKSARHA